ncbi:MAG TPA: efflux RND transporter periplasmic adaptor subunit [Polyangiaceae bacterium]|jgi:RND family efflux transporter MFP subunit
MSDLTSDLASLKIARDRGRPRNTLSYLAIGLGLAIAALVFYLFGAPYLQAKIFKTPVQVTEIAVVSPAQASVELTAAGYVVPETISNIAVKVPGRVAKVFITRGSSVKAGDVLFELDLSDQKASIATAASRVAVAQAHGQTARANLAEAKMQAEREAMLAAEGVSPKSKAQDLQARLGPLEAQVKAADAEVHASESEVQALRVNMDNFKITTPIAGTVLNKPPEIGEFVGPQPAGVAVDMGGVQVADLATLMVETDVPEQRLYLVKVNGPAEITLDAFPGKRYRGKVLEIEPRVNRSKATVTVKTGFVDAAERALPDMAARVSFLTSALDAEAIKQPPKTIVPGAAITDRGGAKVLFAVENDRVRMTPVTLGPAFGTGFELVKGPPGGTRVVKGPGPELTDGQRIKQQSEP